MLLAVNLNPCLDRIYTVPALRLNEVHRTGAVLVQAGGKGINVARAMRTLGAPCLVTGLLGGPGGQQVAADLDNAGLTHDFCAIAGTTRTCIILADPAARTQTVINEAGPYIAAGESHRFVEKFSRLLPSARLVALTGSLPPGVSPALYGELVRLAADRGVPTIVDASGEPLRAAVLARPTAVKVNLRELGDLVGEAELAVHAVAGQTSSLVACCRRLLGGELRHVVVTLGAAGALWVSADEAWLAKAPEVAVINAVGSGDAFTAGLACEFLQAKSLPEMLQSGVAAGSANAAVGGLRFTAADYLALRHQATLTKAD